MLDMRTPYIELPRDARTLIDFNAFCLISLMCDFQSSFRSITIPRYLHVAFSTMFPYLVLTSFSVSKCVRDLVK
jgi:hypothetical protein